MLFTKCIAIQPMLLLDRTERGRKKIVEPVRNDVFQTVFIKIAYAIKYKIMKYRIPILSQ